MTLTASVPPVPSVPLVPQSLREQARRYTWRVSVPPRPGGASTASIQMDRGTYDHHDHTAKRVAWIMERYLELQSRPTCHSAQHNKLVLSRLSVTLALSKVDNKKHPTLRIPHDYNLHRLHKIRTDTFRLFISPAFLRDPPARSPTSWNTEAAESLSV